MALNYPNIMDENPIDVNGEMSDPSASYADSQDNPLADGTPAPGSKTPAELLLISLQQERQKVKDLEAKLNNNSANPALEAEIASIKKRLAEREFQEAKTAVIYANPTLKGKEKEFEKFLADPENNGLSLKNAARLFITDYGFSDIARQGLENKTGGDRTPQQVGMTPEEAEQLRTSNFRLYQKKLIAGEIPSSGPSGN